MDRLLTDDEQVAPDAVGPADAVEFVLDALGFDGAALATLVEVLLLGVGGVARGDDKPVPVGRPIELPDALLEVGYLLGVAAEREVEQPKL